MKTPEELKYKLRIVDDLMDLAWYNYNMILEDNIESSYYDRWSERLEKIAYKLIKEYAKEVWEAAREEDYDVGSGETQAEYCDFEDWYKIAIK